MDEIIAETQATLTKQGRKAMGAAKVRAQRPHDRPKAPARSPKPPCHSTDLTERNAYFDRENAFVSAYRQAARRIRKGIREALDELPRFAFPPPFRPIRPTLALAIG